MICPYLHLSIYLALSLSLYIYIYTYTHLYVYTYIYIYIYIYIYSRQVGEDASEQWLGCSLKLLPVSVKQALISMSLVFSMSRPRSPNSKVDAKVPHSS